MDKQGEEISVGELKAIQRENHLCFECSHAVVCKIATAIEPHLLVIIRQCLAFESDEVVSRGETPAAS